MPCREVRGKVKWEAWYLFEGRVPNCVHFTGADELFNTAIVRVTFKTGEKIGALDVIGIEQ